MYKLQHGNLRLTGKSELLPADFEANRFGQPQTNNENPSNMQSVLSVVIIPGFTGFFSGNICFESKDF